MSARGLFHLSKRASVQRDQPAPHMLYEEHKAFTTAVEERLNIACYLEGLAGGIAAQGDRASTARLWQAAEILREMSDRARPSIKRVIHEHVLTAAPSQFDKNAFEGASTGRLPTLPEQVLGLFRTRYGSPLFH